MRSSLVHEIIGRIYETRFVDSFKEELMRGSFFRKIDERLLEKIVELDDYDFKYYLSFLYGIYKKNNNIMIYYDKLAKITKLMLSKLGSINVSALVDILVNTNLINKEYIVEFANMLLRIKEIKKVDTIVDMVYDQEIEDRNFDILIKSLLYFDTNYGREFIIGLLNNKKMVINEVELKGALSFLNKTQEEYKLVAFYKLFVLGELKDISLYSEYGMLIKNALLKANNQEQLNTIVKLSVVLKTSRFRNSIVKQIINCNNIYALREYEELVKMPKILNDNNIIDIMEKINRIKNDIQGTVISNLLSINPNNILLLIDEVIKKEHIKLLYITTYLEKLETNNLLYLLNDIDLFGMVLDFKDGYKYDFLMKVLNHQEFIMSKKNREVIKDFFKVKEEYKYIAFYKYIKDNANDKEFTLDSNSSRNVITLLKETKKKFQANAVVRISNLSKKFKFNDNILIKAAFVKDEMTGILLGDLIESGISEDERFNDILSNFEKCEVSIASVGMIELAKNMRLRSSKFLLGYFMIMKRLKKINQVGVLLDILEKYPDLDEYELFKYCEKIMFVTNTKLLLIIERLILNNKKINKETMDLCLDINGNSSYENIKFIKEYLRLNGMGDILGEDEVDIEEVIYMLNRQKSFDLNPNSVLVYKKN